MINTTIPSVLVFAGLDPSGGAGIQADIEALASHGCHTCPVMTVNTTQDTFDIKSISPVPADQVIAQAHTITNDVRISAIKIGLIGNVALISELRDFIDEFPDIPVILDPVLSSGNGTSLSDSKYVQALANYLLPVTTILTPNHLEAKTLVNVLRPGLADESTFGQVLLDQGCELVLITGGHRDDKEVINTLYQPGQAPESFYWQRLPGSFHGSGCTLASSLAGLFAQNQRTNSAIQQAQEYTWGSLRHAYSVGHGQSIPNRFFWAQNKTTPEE